MHQTEYVQHAFVMKCAVRIMRHHVSPSSAQFCGPAGGLAITMGVPGNDWPGIGGGPWTFWGKSGQRTALSTPNNDIFNDHPRDPDGADLACAYYGRRLRSLSFPGNPRCCRR